MINKWKYIIISFGLLLCSFILVVALFLTYNRPIGQDTGIILSEMESIAGGYVPYKSMHLNYPPLFFYFMIGLKSLFNIPYGCYFFYLTIHNILLLFVGYFVYKLTRVFLGGGRILSFFTAWLCIILILWYQGCMVLFEVPSLFFGLASTVVVLSKGDNNLNIIIGGILASFSFLTKQFGAAFIILNAYCIIINSKDKLRQLVFYSLGTLIPIAWVLYLFGYDFILSTLFNGYGTTTNALAGEDISIYRKTINIISGCRDFLYACPITICFLLPHTYWKEKWKVLLFCLLGFLFFSFQFFFVYPCSQHYFQYIVPFVAVAASLLLQSKKNQIVYVLFVTVCVFTVIKGIAITFYTPLINYDNYAYQKQEQLLIADKIKSLVGEEQSIWIANTDIHMYYYLTGRKTPNMKEVGFSSGPWEMTIDKAKLQVKDTNFVLCHYDNRYNLADYYFTEDLKKKVYNHAYIDLGNDIRLYKMK